MTKECGNIDVRNEASSIEKLRNCTVIKGFLSIALLRTRPDNNFDNYTFPELREITDFFLLFYVRGIRTLRNLFPNLTVIRGKRLLLNYALAIFSVPNISELGLESLVSIQRGHVYIGQCPLLCHVDTIDWDKIAKSVGKNHLEQSESALCSAKSLCSTCNSKKCWASQVCQKFEEDNLLRPGFNNCHPLCLGGCYNSSNTGCNVCHAISDNGACVEKCPTDKLLSHHELRCYDKKTCLELKYFIVENECWKDCPAGYSHVDPTTKRTSKTHCYLCSNDRCPKVCDGLEIRHLSDAEYLRGCTIINGTLEIKISSYLNEADLIHSLGKIEEISGFLKIYRSTTVTSLNFLENLSKIRGEQLDYDRYALVIYDNQNLLKLWNWTYKKELSIINGGMFIHSNHKLCSKEVIHLQNITNHNKSLDFIYNNVIEPSCISVILESKFKILSHQNVTVYWKDPEIENKHVEFILYYKKSPLQNETTYAENEYCAIEFWQTAVLKPENVQRVDHFWAFNITKLKQYTQYAYYIKSSVYMDGLLTNALTKLQFFTTLPDIPVPPAVTTLKKTANSITLIWASITNEIQLVTYNIIVLFQHLDKAEILDARNYCEEPLIPIHEELKPFEIDCCGKHFYNEEYKFNKYVDNQFRCSLNTPENCSTLENLETFKHSLQEKFQSNKEFNFKEIKLQNITQNYVRQFVIPANINNYTINDLDHFKLYTFQFFSCNNISGCGTYSMHTDRTDKLENADDIDLRTQPNYLKAGHYDLIFRPPNKPNGLTVAYKIHYRGFLREKNEDKIICITRLYHEINNYSFNIYVKNSSYEVQVQSISLAGEGRYTEWKKLKVDIEDYSISQNRLEYIFIILFFILIFGGTLYYFLIYKRILKQATNDIELLENIHEGRDRNGSSDSNRTDEILVAGDDDNVEVEEIIDLDSIDEMAESYM